MSYCFHKAQLLMRITGVELYVLLGPQISVLFKKTGNLSLFILIMVNIVLWWTTMVSDLYMTQTLDNRPNQ